MRGAPAARGIPFAIAPITVLVAAVVGWVAPAASIEFWEDRVSIHGYYEMDVRSIWEDFSGANDWDLTSWAHTLNVEIEADIAPDGFGPFDLISAFGRVEVRFDCVWRRGCGIFSSADAYGDRAGRIPQRVSKGRRSGFSGTMFTGDTRRFNAVHDIFGLGVENKNLPANSRKPVDFSQVTGVEGFFSIVGPDGTLGSADDPALYTFESLLGRRCVYGHKRRKGSNDGTGVDALPWDPRCRIRSNGLLRDRANPLKATDRNPSQGYAGGFAALPLRPAPEWKNAAQLGRRAPDGEAQGIFYPSEKLARLLKDGEFDNFDQNFTVNELQWNRGASQQDEKELKELYLDMELFDSRLWLRVGRQNIVWGKTEFFRTTDQFNPLDLVLSSSFQSLETSRIALWAARAVWSFYEVGPLDDVRLEVAFNYDDFEPTDLGRCGEPYTPLGVCAKTFGLQVHSFAGLGLAGEIKPPDPWNSWKGIEIGGRLEFRYDRFSIALMDFYGYDDSFYVDQIFNYSRNVDPETGRPRTGMSRGTCRTGREPACLTPANALRHHSVNQQVFSMICASSVGFSDLDLSACGQTVFNSRVTADPTNPLSPAISIALTNIMAGQGVGELIVTNGAALMETLGGFTPTTLTAFTAYSNIYNYFTADAPTAAFCGTLGLPPGLCPTPLVPLNQDVNDGPAALAGLPPLANPPFTLWDGTGLAPFLTDEQEALLGCGPFYHTDCDIDGVDFLNMELTAVGQSWPIEGTFFGWDTTDRRRAQPGTVGYQGGPVCTRYERGRSFILPGCRGPGDRGYDPRKDGTIDGLLHPFTGQQFKSEMAALSWNFLMLLVVNSTGDDKRQQDVFDPERPFRTDGCSFRNPGFCSAMTSIMAISTVGRPTVRAGGNGLYGRRDFAWAGAAEAVLRYEKRNVLGLSMDFAEDVTKSNWSFEFTWVEGLPRADADAYDGHSEVDLFNLTVSVDRPTFINFLNANRTFFFNLQFAMQYIGDYTQSHTFSTGPWNFFGVFFISTGYFQDRLLPGVTFIYDKRSNGGAVLTSVTYRFTENFSATFGMNIFSGREKEVPLSVHPVGTGNRVGRHRGKSFTEPFTSAVRERDEAFLRLRYTF